MNLVDAIRASQWVRRRGWQSWMLASRRGPVLRVSSVKWRELTYADLIADDWEPHISSFDVSEEMYEEDPATTRFRLMEIE